VYVFSLGSALLDVEHEALHQELSRVIAALIPALRPRAPHVAVTEEIVTQLADGLALIHAGRANNAVVRVHGQVCVFHADGVGVVANVTNSRWRKALLCRAHAKMSIARQLPNTFRDILILHTPLLLLPQLPPERKVRNDVDEALI